MKTSGWMKLFAIVLALVIVGGCSENSGIYFDTAHKHYKENDLEKAKEYFEKAVKLNADDAQIHSWLAETNRRMGLKQESYDMANKALEIDPHNSFSHTVLGDLLNPMYGIWERSDSELAWLHLTKAVEYNPADGNAWLAIWSEAVRRGEKEIESKAYSALMETGILTPAILSYNRWTLEHLPPNAILLTNGDMDTYPALALQEVENFRTDVAIVNYSLLNTPWYANHIKDKYGIRLPLSDDEITKLKPVKIDGHIITTANQIMRAWLKARENGECENPIAIANTVADLSFAETSQDHFCSMGAFRIWMTEPSKFDADTTAVRKSLESVKPEQFTGPFASPDDRSPIRLISTNTIVTNITLLALDYSNSLIEAGRNDEAGEMLAWAMEFEKNTELGPVFIDQINTLKEEMIK